MRAASLVVLILCGCAAGPGRIRTALPESVEFATLPRPLVLVSGGSYDCGPEVLHALLRYNDEPSDFEELTRTLALPGVDGTFPPRLIECARSRGLEVRTVEGSFETLKSAIDAGVPPILLIRSTPSSNHYMVAVAYASDGDEELAAFEFYRGWKWIFTRAELEEAWRPCGFLQLEFVSCARGAALGRARALEAEGKLSAALAEYRALIARDPNDGEARLGAGNCLALQGEFATARREYLLAVEGGTEGPELWNNLADVSLAAGDSGDSVQLWATAAVHGFEEEVRRAGSPLARAIAMRKLASALGTLGEVQLARRATAAARSSFERSLTLLGENDTELRRKRLEQIDSCR